MNVHRRKLIIVFDLIFNTIGIFCWLVYSLRIFRNEGSGDSNLHLVLYLMYSIPICIFINLIFQGIYLFGKQWKILNTKIITLKSVMLFVFCSCVPYLNIGWAIRNNDWNNLLKYYGYIAIFVLLYISIQYILSYQNNEIK
jgi:uncharacterized protein with PQ loop repeat